MGGRGGSASPDLGKFRKEERETERAREQGVWKKARRARTKEQSNRKGKMCPHTHTQILIKIHTTQRWWCLVVAVAVAGGEGV